ncbi:hypothetical protein [Amycolatopsis sp. cmx-11-51]|uniref:hypothetical protein n=1 Tax=Amycolatopsis sp. cmx-11-51 TaxID=2785797 RepID=UPI0039E53730
MDPAGLLVDMGTFAAGALTLLFVRFPNLSFRRREENFRSEIRNGRQFITRRPGLRAALRFFVIDHVFHTLGFAVITPMLLVEQPASVLGLALGTGGVGGLTGSALFGGLSPLVSTLLFQAIGSVWPTIGLLIGMCVLSIVCVLAAPQHTDDV